MPVYTQGIMLSDGNISTISKNPVSNIFQKIPQHTNSSPFFTESHQNCASLMASLLSKLICEASFILINDWVMNQKMGNKDILGILNHLILINNDRIDGYEKAQRQCKQKYADLQILFDEMIELSFENKKELEDAVENAGGELTTDTTTAGKIHRIWMDIDAALSGFEKHTLLANCETGEDAALKAYQHALSENLPYQVCEMIQNQEQRLRSAHNKIKYLRDEKHIREAKG